MMKKCHLLFAIGLLMLLCPTSHGTVVEFQCENLQSAPLPTSAWSFDYDTQALTFTERRHEVPADPPVWDYWSAIRIGGRLDRLTVGTFAVNWNVVNESPVAWTGLVLAFASDHGTHAGIVDDSAYSSAFSEVTGYGPGDRTLVFSGDGIVLPGETLAVQFDVWVDGQHSFGGFSIVVDFLPVPEPGTIVVFGCGLLMLRNKYGRRAATARK